MPESDAHKTEDLACLPESRVIEVTGLSASAIRKLVGEGSFPAPRQYKNVRKKFYAADEIRIWLINQRC